jgi:hypothetical protein
MVYLMMLSVAQTKLGWMAGVEKDELEGMFKEVVIT